MTDNRETNRPARPSPPVHPSPPAEDRASGAPLRAQVLLFAGLKAAAGGDRIDLEFVTPAVTVAQLRAAILSALPQARELVLASRFAVDHEFVDESTLVPLAPANDRDSSDSHSAHATPRSAHGTRLVPEIALIPPVSGGHDGPVQASSTTPRPPRVALSHAPLELRAVQDAIASLAAGALVSFEGKVREHSRGLVVTHLEYEAYPSMALRVMTSIIEEIEREHAGARVAIHHRLGRLELGETAVIIVAAAPHRAEAFAACRAAIERLKADVPIWKKEFDAQGGTWISQGP